MKILNLYAGIGGNRKLWGDEYDITAVELDRHLFWSNFEIPSKSFDKHPDVSRSKKEDLAAYHGIDLPPKTKDQRKLLRNAVNPLVGEYILNQLTQRRTK
jgi:hypothetical protein